MAVVSSMPSSIKIQCSKPSDGPSGRIVASATITRTAISYHKPPGTHHLQLTINSTTPSYNPISHGTAPTPKKSWSSAFENYDLKEETEAANNENQDLQKEADRIIRRLKRAVEKVREMEVNKFRGKVKDVAAMYEDGGDEMSREIVCQYLERPIRYLRSGCGNLEERLRDVSLLVGMFEDFLVLN